MILFNDNLESYKQIEFYIEENEISNVFIICDENTRNFCFPLFKKKINLKSETVIEIKSGEKNKNLNTCKVIWEQLIKHQCDRKSLIINLGGGVITDIGGFAASVFKRGIKFINIPTTLLSMVDASSGGKTGVDFLDYKNMIGCFSEPEVTLIDLDYLDTLEEIELKSGFAEMLKHGLIKSREHWEELVNTGYKKTSYNLVKDSLNIKSEVVKSDPLESGERKLLNFGHTIGHAIESFSLNNDEKPLTHGKSVAIGMIIESYISYKMNMLDKNILDSIKQNIFNYFSYYKIPISGFDDILKFIENDKKNYNGKINFVLLENIGESIFNIVIEKNVILNALNFYSDFTDTGR